MSKYLATRLSCFMLAAFAIVFGSVELRGQDAAKDKSVAPGTSQAKPGNVSDPADLEAFFDGVVNTQMETRHIAGSVVAVVVGDKLVFSKGYGFADVEARRKVNPAKTLFRIASISKLFTWTAVMQLVEEGKVDLNTDVNKYLKGVTIPATFEQPITLKDILTHTPGFEDYVLGLFARSANEVGPLAQVLNSQMPARVRPPGILASYSNHGTAIAGYVVESVSGLPWAEYIEKRILKPLGMNHTLVRQPSTDRLPKDLSNGYKWEGGRFVVKPFEYCPAAPAGCISTTADDASRFMLAMLHDGQLGKERILKPETARLMREPLFRADPKTCAMCYGLMELERNGVRMVGHGGDTIWFHSLMELMPEKQVGLFVSYNTDTSGGVREVLLDSFLKRYFPISDVPVIKATSDSQERLQRVAGEYGTTRYSHTTPTKIGTLLGAIKVSANKDNTITVAGGDSARRYAEIEPLVFRELDGQRKVVFQEGKDGRIRYLFFADGPAGASVRREWYELGSVQQGLAAGALGIFASALLFWPAIAFSVRGLQSPKIIRTRFSAILSCLAWFLSLVALVFAGAVTYGMTESSEIVFGLTPLLKRLLLVPQFVVVLVVLTVIGCLIAWKNRYWRFTGRLHYTLVAVAGLLFITLLYYWNLLPFGWQWV